MDLARRRWDYLFVCSARPAPRSLEKLNAVVEAGRCACLIYLDRAVDGIALLPPPSAGGIDVRVFRADFSRVEPRRLISIARFAVWLAREIFPHVAASGADLYVDSLDLLAAVIVGGGSKRRATRYEVRDLNAIQLGNGLVPAIVRHLEHRLMGEVSRLVLTSEAYRERYYQRVFQGAVTIVENWPRDAVARKPVRANRDGRFWIGYVGVIRYHDPIRTLLRAVKALRAAGADVGVRFYGGGDLPDVEGVDLGAEAWIESSGPFRYDDEIRDIYGRIDLNYSVYDPRIENVRHAMPNKFYESILYSVPILVASGTYLERRVREEVVGIGVDPFDVEAHKEVLIPALRNEGWYARALARFVEAAAPSVAERKATILEAVLG